MSSTGALATVLGAGGLAAIWYASMHLTGTGDYWLGVQPIFPGLALSVMIYIADMRLTARA